MIEKIVACNGDLPDSDYRTSHDASFRACLNDVQSTAPAAVLPRIPRAALPMTGTVSVVPTWAHTPQSPFEGLSLGAVDSAPGGAVHRMQHVLKRWNPHLDIEVSGRYDSSTANALALYQSIYGGGGRPEHVDSATAHHLSDMEKGTFGSTAPIKTPAQKFLYQAAQHLGTPYHMGGNGVHSTDCGMLVRSALVASKQGPRHVSRMADEQFASAQRGNEGMVLHSGPPQPGDIVFFTNPTSQSAIAYHGVTHVGISLGGGRMLAASSAHGQVVVQKMGSLSRYVAGYARVGSGTETLATNAPSY